MKLKIMAFVFMFICLSINSAWSASPDSTKIAAPEKEIPLVLDKIIDGVEKRYAGSGFQANFQQKSVLKAMEITDTASGKLFIKRPSMMRWEYKEPDKQIIISDGKTLWIYRPEDNQVMVGNAPAYFGDGKGASFLSDIKIVRQNFDVTFEKQDDPRFHQLKLLPKEARYDLAKVYLSISKENFDIIKIITYNFQGDETQIDLSDFELNQTIDDSMFSFTIPPGTDILKLEDSDGSP